MGEEVQEESKEEVEVSDSPQATVGDPLNKTLNGVEAIVGVKLKDREVNDLKEELGHIAKDALEGLIHNEVGNKKLMLKAVVKSMDSRRRRLAGSNRKFKIKFEIENNTLNEEEEQKVVEVLETLKQKDLEKKIREGLKKLENYTNKSFTVRVEGLNNPKKEEKGDD